MFDVLPNLSLKVRIRKNHPSGRASQSTLESTCLTASQPLMTTMRSLPSRRPTSGPYWRASSDHTRWLKPNFARAERIWGRHPSSGNHLGPDRFQCKWVWDLTILILGTQEKALSCISLTSIIDGSSFGVQFIHSKFLYNGSINPSIVAVERSEQEGHREGGYKKSRKHTAVMTKIKKNSLLNCWQPKYSLM